MAHGQDQIRQQILEYAETRPELDQAGLRSLSLPVLAIWRTVELTYALEGAGPSGRSGFTVGDFMTNLRRTFPEILDDFGDDFCRTLLQQYLSFLQHLRTDPAASVEMARRLDSAVGELLYSDLPSLKPN